MSSDQVISAPTGPIILALPREIRDEIYLTILQSPNEPPSSPEYPSPIAAGSGTELKRHPRIRYPVNIYPRYTCQDLLESNHQLNTEVREALARHDASKQGLDSKLDLMIRGFDVWPTWTLLPGPVTHIRNLGVEMRIFDDYHGSQFDGDGGPGPIFQPLFHLLSGFFHHGPQFVYKGPVERQLHVDTMTFTIYVSSMKKEQLQKDVFDVQSQHVITSVRRRIVHSVWLKLRMIASRGALSGRVSRLKLITDEDVKEFLVPDRKLAQETVDYWDAYGYHWGVGTLSDHGF